MQIDSGCRHRFPTFSTPWRWLLLSLAAAVASVGVAQAQNEALQYAGGKRDVEPLSVITDTTITAQLVRNLAENFVQVESIAQVGESPVDHQLTDSDRQAIQDADLLVYQGLGLMPGFIEAAQKRDADARVELADRIPGFRLIKDADGKVNPYTYLSPALLQFAVDHLTTRLKKRLEPVAGEIEGNRLRINIELQSLKRETEGLLEDVPRGERVMVTDNDVFAYFAKAHYFQLLNVNRDADSKKAVEQINRYGTPNVFEVAGVGDGAIESWLDAHRGKDIPADVGLADDLNGLWLGGSNRPTGTYIGLFRQNVNTLLLGLKPLPSAGDKGMNITE